VDPRGAAPAFRPTARLRLEAFRHYYIPSGNFGLSGIVAKPTPTLIQLQQDVIDALAPFTVKSGTSSAFVTTPDDLVMNPALIEYVSAFVPKASGDHFDPHVTTGIAPREILDHMLEEPFESFEFGPVGAAVYQLGQYGTAAKRLKGLASAGASREGDSFQLGGREEVLASTPAPTVSLRSG
jgi:hypothetical protein